jgi:ABC-2 type transport system permease protein
MNWIGLYTFIRREFERTLRVVTQTLVTPWISAVLYIFVFGKIVGSRIALIEGVHYIDFVLPGILMMNVLTSAFSAASSAIYMQRFIRSIEELLVAPLSYLEMVVGFVSSAVVRAVLVGIGIYIIAILFSAASIAHVFFFLFYSLSVAAIFALLGLIVGLWANGFEQLNILSTFVITPLSYLGGMFYSLSMLPPPLQLVARFNPFFYFIDGIRYSMIGVHDAPIVIGIGIILALILVLGAIVWKMFSSGWRLRP